MKVDISTAGYFYNDDGKKELEKLGFTFDPSTSFPNLRWTIKGEVTKDMNESEILEFVEEWGECVISVEEDGIRLTIYDSYLE